MAARRPLCTLLSQVLIAHTIEFDNEAERRIAEEDSRPRILVSLVMWSNYLRFVGEDGLKVHELQALAGVSESAIHSRLAGLHRWGYVTVGPDGAARNDRVVRVTPAGRSAQEVWRPLVGEIEERWWTRFGADAMGALRASSEGLVGRLDLELPRYLPVLSFADGMRAEVDTREEQVSPGRLDLPALLSQVLLAFTFAFERESDLSLAIGANTLRVLDEHGVRVRDLPGLTGVSKEAVSASVGFLRRRGYAMVEADPTASRGQRVRLTPKGQHAQLAYRRLLGLVERRWEARFGADELHTFREPLEWLTEEPEDEQPRLSPGLQPSPGGWRARKPYLNNTMAVLRDPAGTLPHYPMVLHRGGWPDGS